MGLEYASAETEHVIDTSELVTPNDVVPEATELSDAVLEWNVDHLDEYDPLTWLDKEKRHVRRKGFRELSLFVQVTSGLHEQHESIAPLAEHVVETVNDRRYFELLARQPEAALKFGYPFVVPADRDELSPDAAATLRRAMAKDAPWAVDRLPFTRLNNYHFLHQIGYGTRHLDPEDILAASNARTAPNFVQVDRKQVYALTHNVFFYTNFGTEATGYPDTRVPTDLSTALTGLILRFLADDDTDAVSELLLTGIIQLQLDPDFVRVIFSWLRSVANERDVVPGSGVRDATASPDQQVRSPDLDADTLGDWSEESQEWFHDYHTVLASGLCFGILERDWDDLREHAPDRDLDHGRQDVLDQLMALGETIRLLSEYKLAEAAALIESLAGSPVFHAYEDVFETCAEFLRDQRTHDGHIGFFTDERYLYVSQGNSRESFERELLVPCTERCEDALAAVERSQQS